MFDPFVCYVSRSEPWKSVEKTEDDDDVIHGSEDDEQEDPKDYCKGS
jgi:hypothetical protein